MSNLISSDDPFDERDKESLREILRYMIPAHGPRPAADDPLIFADFLATAKPHAQAVHEVLALRQDISLEALSKAKNPQVGALVGIVVQCYYRDDRVLRAIEMEPRAPHPAGYDLEQGDWSLLEPVRQRGKIYRDAD